MDTHLKPYERIIFDLNVEDIKKAISLANELYYDVGLFKIDCAFIFSVMEKILSSSFMEDLMDCLQSIGYLVRTTREKVFLDLNLNSTVSNVEELSFKISLLKPRAFSVYELSQEGSFAMSVINKDDSKVFGTSASSYFSKEECMSNFGTSSDMHILKFAKSLVDEGVDGVICSLEQGHTLRLDYTLDKLLIACPLRQTSKTNAFEAMKMGVDYLIIGSEIIENARNAKIIAKEINLGLKEKRNFRIM